MQLENYKNWLRLKGYQAGTITAQMHRVGRVEDYYGDLDVLHNEDRLESLISELTYTTSDRNNNRPNETKIPFEGNAYNNLSSYKDAVRRYRRFLEENTNNQSSDDISMQLADSSHQQESAQTIGLERDMQAAIRRNITQIEPGLTISDGGKERCVETGRIDITAKDMDGLPVVIELKTGTAGQRAVAQILSYMGSVMDEEEQDNVRGILVASDFDSKARAAAKVIPSLTLMRYQFSFNFYEE